VLVAPCTVLDDGVTSWCEAIVAQARTHRGGDALLSELLRGRDVATAVSDAVNDRSLWTATIDGAPVAVALIENGFVQGIYVAATHRRNGIARHLLAEVAKSGVRLVDAFALPGDRATKSLYESMGWKARLLTMRGA